jgi:hypothetical protein
MANGRMSCPVCAFEIATGTRFCGECGASIPEELSQARSKPAPTILGIDAEAVRLAAAAAQAAVAGDTSQRSDAPPAAESRRRDGSAAADGSRAEDLRASLRPPGRDNGARASLSAPPAPSGIGSGQRAQADQASGAASTSMSPAAELGAAAGSGAGDRALNRTRLDGGELRDGSAPPSGMPPNLEARAAAVPSTLNWAQRTSLGWGEAPLSSAAPSKVMHGRTMLGVPLASISPSLAPHMRDARESAHGTGAAQLPRAGQGHREGADSASTTPESSGTRPTSAADSQAGGQTPSTAPSSGTRALLGGFIAGIVLIALATAVYVRMAARQKAVDVRAHIMTNEQGEILQFDVPAALEGARLRFGGQEQPIVGGRAMFPLASDSLRVGDNVVLADVVAPTGEHSSARIVIALAYRLWVDTSGLLGPRPSIDVKVAALPGTRVLLDGSALALEQRDGQSHGSKTYPLEPPRGGKGGVIDHVVQYRIEPPKGAVVTDQLKTRIPIATLQIDRPGPDLITDSDTVEIAGSVGRDTGVSVDGRQVPVKDGRFVQRLALPKPGEYKPRVTAGSDGKLPVSATLNIRRVRDLTQAAHEFSFDKNLTYAKVASAPDNYRGQPIAIEGRVYAVDARAGSSVVQMLTRPCPSGQRCSLWVVDPQARDVAVDHWVRVLGVVDGEQQFRSENNQIVTVPKVIAQFILPARP